ncbi:MAG: sugar phosphate isomerase/epimerase [Abditibacteriota bacterium]|nr:sugar phosphate isomerase/epimerase [Abditibacteriota bacterium]
MYLTGFADEASQEIEKQITVTKALGWENIESRNIKGTNIHNISDEEFDYVFGKLQDSGVKINCFGSAIANWSHSIKEPFDITLEEIKRAIPRMKKLGTKLIRIMSYAILYDAPATKEGQMFDERVKRVKEIIKIFEDEGITPVHENCMNYGGLGWKYTLDLIEAIPNLKLVFDTGNPVFSHDFSKASKADLEKPIEEVKNKPPMQNAWEFYIKVKPYIKYIHIKDGYFDFDNKTQIFTYPNIGKGYIKEILTDLIKGGYDGGISIEPHVATVYHDNGDEKVKEELKYNAYFHYGIIINQLIDYINKN